MNIRLSLVIVLTGAGATGCGDSALTVREAIAGIASADCARFLRCCTQAQINCIAGHSIGEADCEELVALALRELTYVTDEAVDEGRRSVDEDAVRECLDGIETASCDYGADFPDACDDLFPGEQRIGDECLYAGECSSGTRCSTEGKGSDRGVCVPLQGEEEICFRHSHCEEGLYCSADGYVCRPRAVEGSGCEDATDDVSEAPLCAEGLGCNDDERCEGPGGLGDPCGFGCEDGLICGLDSECAEPLADGEACIFGGECASGWCDFDPGPDGECEPDPRGCYIAYGLIGVEECEP